MNVPKWKRQGLIVKPGILGPEWSLHCQMPTPAIIDNKTLRIYFSSRDKWNRSHIFSVDLQNTPPWTVKSVTKQPILSPGDIGTFDAHGVMPTAIINNGNELWMYYIGWSVREDVPYHNAIGIARSLDAGDTFQKLFPGPVISTHTYEPYFCGTADVMVINNQWNMWYMSATEWRIIDGKPEPRYHIKQATSNDGMSWKYGKNIAIDYQSEDEGGIARATVLRDNGEYWMWFCYRGIEDYRGTGVNAYRLGVAHSYDGSDWKRIPAQQIFTTQPKPDDFDYYMECYPAVLNINDESFIFYNGSDFGQSGIGYAVREDKLPDK